MTTETCVGDFEVRKTSITVLCKGQESVTGLTWRRVVVYKACVLASTLSSRGKVVGGELLGWSGSGSASRKVVDSTRLLRGSCPAQTCQTGARERREEDRKGREKGESGGEEGGRGPRRREKSGRIRRN